MVVGGERFNCDRLKVLKWHQHTPESLNFTCIFVVNVLVCAKRVRQV